MTTSIVSGLIAPENVALNIVSMIKIFTDALDKYRIPYSLYGGTLLGAVRHKGMIPWDHDSDIAVFSDDYKMVLKELFDTYKFTFQQVHTDFAKLHYTWASGSCVLDIFVFRSFNKGRDMSTRYHRDMLPKRSIFPLQKLDFHGMSLSCLKDPHYFFTKYRFGSYMTEAIYYGEGFLKIPIDNRQRIKGEPALTYRFKFDLNRIVENVERFKVEGQGFVQNPGTRVISKPVNYKPHMMMRRIMEHIKIK